MLNNKPLVSVIMTVRNARLFLREAIESILKQTYSHLELIIIDDGSVDGSIEIIRDMAMGDKRIKSVILNKNYGPSYASNVGIKLSKGVYIARMDADDIAYPARIERQVNFLEKHPNVVLLGGQCKLINENGRVIGKKNFPLKHEDIYKSLFRMNPIQHPSCMINTHLIHRSILVYHNHFVLAHDLELVFDLTRYGKLANLAGDVLYYRQHSNSLSLKDPKETFRATLKIRKKALKCYGYKPDVLGRIVNLLQTIVVYMLPREAIYPIYRIFRMQKTDSVRNIINETKGYIKSSFSSRLGRFKTNLASYLAE